MDLMNLPDPRPMPCAKCGATITAMFSTDRCAACQRLEVLTEVRAAARSIATRAIPPRFRWASFDAPELVRRVTPASAVATVGTAPCASITFRGPSGSGKTSLAVALSRKWLLETLTPTEGEEFLGFTLGDVLVFSSCASLAGARTATKFGQLPEGIEEALGATITILDDLGTESAGDRDLVRRIIHERHDEQRVTIATTFLSVADVTSVYGAGTARRLFGEGLVELGGKR